VRPTGRFSTESDEEPKTITENYMTDVAKVNFRPPMTFISPLDQSRTSSARSSMRRRPTIVKPSLESRLSEKGSALLKNFNQSRLSIKK